MSDADNKKVRNAAVFDADAMSSHVDLLNSGAKNTILSSRVGC